MRSEHSGLAGRRRNIAARRFRKNRTRAVPVAENGKVVGRQSMVMYRMRGVFSELAATRGMRDIPNLYR